MTDAPRLRQAVRAVVLDEADRILLVRLRMLDRVFWAAPGGGVETGERDHDALTRELAEEVGLCDAAIGPLIWTRTHRFAMPDGHDGQVERLYLVRGPAFEPRPELSTAALDAEGVTDVRWWGLDALWATDEELAPRRLPALLDDLLAHGPPDAPIDVGV